MDFYAEYKSKLGTPEQAAALVKSGDWVEYGNGTTFAELCDAALAKRRDELFDVKFRGQIMYGPIQVVECDPTGEHFCYNAWHASGYDRKLMDQGKAYFSPMIFRNLAWYHREFLHVNVAFVCATPMDKHGYFNFSVSAGTTLDMIGRADKIVLEINPHLPKIYGAYNESIHISDVTMVVEGHESEVPTVASKTPSAEDIAIANNVLPYIVDGSTLQLGIGGTPDALGSILAQSDLKDLGMHTELCTDGFLDLYKAGKLTNKRKNIFPGKGVLGLPGRSCGRLGLFCRGGFRRLRRRGGRGRAAVRRRFNPDRIQAVGPAHRLLRLPDQVGPRPGGPLRLDAGAAAGLVDGRGHDYPALHRLSQFAPAAQGGEHL